MPTFEPFDVVSVPFPYADQERFKRRPALVVSSAALLQRHGLLWVGMITSATQRRRPDDVEIDNLAAAGLSRPSVVRAAKLAAVEPVRLRRIGAVSPAVATKVSALLLGWLARPGPSTASSDEP